MYMYMHGQMTVSGDVWGLIICQDALSCLGLHTQLVHFFILQYAYHSRSLLFSLSLFNPSTSYLSPSIFLTSLPSPLPSSHPPSFPLSQIGLSLH